jgi:hypothetical protein
MSALLQYEENGDKLYHAAARVNNIMVPGKTGHHLYVPASVHLGMPLITEDFTRGAANISFGGDEHVIQDNYEILWVFPGVICLLGC